MIKRPFTEEEMQALATFEDRFKTMREAQWCRPLGETAIDTLLNLWERVTGTKYPYKRGCSRCATNLVKDMGAIYDKQLAEETAAKVSETAVEETEAPKTTKPTTNKRKPAKKAK